MLALDGGVSDSKPLGQSSGTPSLVEHSGVPSSLMYKDFKSKIVLYLALVSTMNNDFRLDYYSKATGRKEEWQFTEVGK